MSHKIKVNLLPWSFDKAKRVAKEIAMEMEVNVFLEREGSEFYVCAMADLEVIGYELTCIRYHKKKSGIAGQSTKIYDTKDQAEREAVRFIGTGLNSDDRNTSITTKYAPHPYLKWEDFPH